MHMYINRGGSRWRQLFNANPSSGHPRTNEGKFKKNMILGSSQRYNRDLRESFAVAEIKTGFSSFIAARIIPNEFLMENKKDIMKNKVTIINANINVAETSNVGSFHFPVYLLTYF